jgi:hypothetical protein
MNDYAHPAVIHTYSISELRADAASCTLYLLTSDQNLKRDIETVEQPLARIRSISTE